MSSLPVTEKVPPPQGECLRVALEPAAAEAYRKMIARLKAESQYLRAHPSKFVSFLVSDFYATYFEEDISILVAKFFDSKAFMSDQIKTAKGSDDAATILQSVTDTVEKLKSQGAKGTLARRKRRAPLSDETVLK